VSTDAEERAHLDERVRDAVGFHPPPDGGHKASFVKRLEHGQVRSALEDMRAEGWEFNHEPGPGKTVLASAAGGRTLLIRFAADGSVENVSSGAVPAEPRDIGEEAFHAPPVAVQRDV